MRILSGDDSRVTSFLGEYARVMGGSGWLAWGAAQGGGGLRQVGRTLAASIEGLRPLLVVARFDPQGFRSNAEAASDWPDWI